MDHSVGPISALAAIRQFWRWRLEEVPGSDLVKVSTPLDALVMTRDRAGMMLYEWRTWMRYYAPHTFDFSGKTVLDVGAGEGETVELYRLLGAKRFICVEPDPQRAGRLRENSVRNGWDAEVCEEPFSPKFLERPFDFMKMDCEGCERALIGTRIAFPSVLEAHGSSTTEEFRRIGFSVVKAGENASLLSNVAQS
ncbi:MAG: hypothetical protein ABSG45_02065 [Nitrososphaerales archaeon]